MKTILQLFILIFIINLNSFAQSVDLQKGLVAYFPFDGNAVDETGSGNIGLVNGASLTSDRNGKPNAAYKFANNDDYIKVPLTSKNFEGDYSISCWVSFDNFSISYPSIVVGDKNFIALHGQGSAYKSQDQNKVVFYQDNSTKQAENRIVKPILTEKLKTNTFYHITVVKSAEKCTIYLNGVKQSEGNVKKSAMIYGSYIRIGNAFRQSTNRCLKGKVDDVFIYNRAINDAEIAALYETEALEIVLEKAEVVISKKEAARLAKVAKKEAAAKNKEEARLAKIAKQNKANEEKEIARLAKEKEDKEAIAKQEEVEEEVVEVVEGEVGKEAIAKEEKVEKEKEVVKVVEEDASITKKETEIPVIIIGEYEDAMYPVFKIDGIEPDTMVENDMGEFTLITNAGKHDVFISSLNSKYTISTNMEFEPYKRYTLLLKKKKVKKITTSDDVEVRAYMDVKTNYDIESCETYLRKYLHPYYPKSYFHSEVKSILEELKLYEKAKKSAISCNKYLSKYPKGKFIEEVKKNKQELLYTTAIKGNTLDCYTYLSEYPNGKYVEEVKKRKYSLIYYIATTGNVSDCDTYLSKYPKGKDIEEVKKRRELILYELAMSSGASECDEYLADYPNGKYVAKVKSHKEDVFYKAAMSGNEFDAYLSKYPRGKYVSNVKTAKEKLKAKQKETEMYNKALGGSIADCDTYLSNYPQGEYAKIIKGKIEEIYYDKAVSGEKSDIKTYLSKYPNGAYVKDANKLIAKYEIKDDFKRAGEAGANALMAFCEKYPNTPEAREAVVQINKIIKRDLGVVSSTAWYARGDRDWLDDFYEDARDVMGGGKKFNYFFAGVFRNDGDYILNVKFSMTIYVKYSCTTGEDIDTYKDVEYFRVYPGQDVPFLFVHKGITEGTRMYGFGCSLSGFGKTKFKVEHYPNTISDETLRKQHKLIKQVAQNGNIKTKMSPKDNTNKWVDDFFGTSSSGNSEVKVYFYKKNSSSETVKINSNGSTLDKESVSSSGSQTLTFNVKSNQNYQIISPSIGTINVLVKGRITHIIIDDDGEYKIDYQDVY